MASPVISRRVWENQTRANNQVNTSQDQKEFRIADSLALCDPANLALDLTPVSRYHRGTHSWVPACPRKGHMSILKSIGAILAGAIIGIALSLATDSLMHALHIFPPLG